MIKTLLGALAGGIALAAAGMAEATPITYDEATDGDISVHSFTFDVGSNSILGSSSSVGDDGDISTIDGDSDPFSFMIQPGQELLSITLVVDDVTIAGNPPFTGISYDITGDATASTGLFALTGPLSMSLFASELPFAAGTYLFSGSIVAPPGFRYDYGLTFEVSSLTAVPEPSSLALLGAGLAGLGTLVWRRRKSRRIANEVSVRPA